MATPPPTTPNDFINEFRFPTPLPTVSAFPTSYPSTVPSTSREPSQQPSSILSDIPSSVPSQSSSPTTSLEETTVQPAYPTPRPTPTSPFPYRAEGDGSFGHKWQDQYTLAHQLAVRRPGWSWGDIKSGPAPFCYGNKCYNVTEACEQLDGVLLHSSVCSFPEEVKIAGPSCWRESCTAEGQQTCKAVQGISIGEPDGSGGPQWCLFKGGQSMIGPMCYGPDCFPDEARNACDSKGGRIWNENYCFLHGYHTTVGPVCWDGLCIFGDAKNKCEVLGGTLFADRWCVIPGCDYTVIGPTCSLAPVTAAAQCFQEETVKLCNKLNGIHFGNRFCLLEGTDWTFIGPTVYQRTETIGQTNDFCRELKQGLSGYFNFMESHEIAGRFCLVKERVPTTTPFCNDYGCNTTMGQQFCNRFGGKDLASGFMCSLCDSFRQVVGPLTWNGNLLEGNPDYCEGHFCAIPNRASDINVNRRCPSSDPIVTRCASFGGAKGVDTGLIDGGLSLGNATNASGLNDTDGQSSGTSSNFKRSSRRVTWLWVLSTTILWFMVSSGR